MKTTAAGTTIKADAASSVGRHGMVSVGYEGREISEFVSDLALRDVTILFDVRLNAVSRRRGFSKTALGDALRSAGIEYRHLRALGNPRENRAAFHGQDVESGRAIFRQVLATEQAAADLAVLREHARTAVVAVLCVEADEHRCHRRVIVEEASRPEV